MTDAAAPGAAAPAGRLARWLDKGNRHGVTRRRFVVAAGAYAAAIGAVAAWHMPADRALDLFRTNLDFIWWLLVVYASDNNVRAAIEIWSAWRGAAAGAPSTAAAPSPGAAR